ncbi:DMT family transporter [Haloarchaeobius amylolyticus]|uniref:DMT family transporter n=1 Tax=Haloarchaeobius amylolyticus TaxID=1198296 RepID=UPI00226FAE27|nr:DMT family transporter [Haloarchaeobius amylolyticus]
MVVDRQTLRYFLTAAVLFGGTFVAAKAGLAYFPPLLFVAFRFDIAALVLVGYVLATRSRSELLPRTRGDVVGILATGVFAIGAANALLFVGQQYTTSAVGAIMASLNPVLTPVFAALLLGDERVSPRVVAGLLLGLVGVGLVVGFDPTSVSSLGVGKLVLFAGAAIGALGTVLIRWGDGSLSSTVRTAWGLPFAAALTHGLSWATGEQLSAVTVAPAGLLTLVYLGVFAGAIAYIAYFGLIDEVGAVRANLVFYATPIVATLGGWALLSEGISANAMLGFGVIFAGFAVLGSDSIDLGDVLPAVGDTPEESGSALNINGEPRGFESD